MSNLSIFSSRVLNVYLRIQFAVVAILLLGLAGFNYIVDPYGVYSPENSFNFSKDKTEFFLKEPVIKPYRVSEMQPDTLILGLSGAGLGYDENHPYFSDKSTYNFSMAGASMYMIYRAFQHAAMESNVKRVFLDLSIVAFNEYHAFAVRNDENAIGAIFEGLIVANEDGSRNWLAIFSKITQIPQYLLSSQATKDSLSTLRKQGAYDDWNLNSHGGWRGATLPPGQSQGKRFRQVENYLVNGFFNDTTATHAFSIYREDGQLSRAFDYYERFLDDAYRKNIEVTLVFSPSHVYMYEAMDFLGLGEMFIDWKRRVVMLNEKIANRYGKTPFPVWDFAYYSELTTEPVPAREDNTTRMKWHFDPLHFTRVAGNQVLDQVYLGHDGAGIRMTADNLDAVLELERQEKQKFHTENVELISKLTATFRLANKNVNIH